jgi:predicted nucleic acid-binding protein
MFIDTSVFIWAFRGNQKAIQLLDNTDDLLISNVVYIELIQGARNKQELQAIDKTLTLLQVSIIDVNERISLLATHLVKQYFHSHAIELADAFIGATAILHKECLATCNIKHFTPMQDLVIVPFNPN